MDTNAVIRDLVRQLLAEGLNQKTLAKRMGRSPTWLSRWLTEYDNRVLSIAAIDGLLSYLHDHQAVVSRVIHGIQHSLAKAPRPDEGPIKTARGSRK